MDKQIPAVTTPRIRRRTVTVDEQLSAPKGLRLALARRSSDRFGQFTESVARAMGTPWFLIGLSIFVVLWMTYNTLVPEDIRFDSAAIGFTALTLILSLQASYAELLQSGSIHYASCRRAARASRPRRGAAARPLP